MSIPLTDGPLDEWGGAASARLTASGTTVYLLEDGQVENFNSVYAAYHTALQAVAIRENRSTALCTVKSQKKADFLEFAREIYGIIQANPFVSDDAKQLLGITVRPTHYSPAPVLNEPPFLKVVKRIGNEVTYGLSDGTSTRRKVAGAQGAMIYTLVAPEPSADVSAWTCQGQTGKTTFVMHYPPELPAGTQVWATVQWYNTRGTSPACTPVGTVLAGGAMNVPSGVTTMKVAA